MINKGRRPNEGLDTYHAPSREEITRNFEADMAGTGKNFTNSTKLTLRKRRLGREQAPPTRDGQPLGVGESRVQKWGNIICNPSAQGSGGTDMGRKKGSERETKEPSMGPMGKCIHPTNKSKVSTGKWGGNPPPKTNGGRK